MESNTVDDSKFPYSLCVQGHAGDYIASADIAQDDIRAIS